MIPARYGEIINNLKQSKIVSWFLTLLAIISFKYPQVAFIFHFHNQEDIKPWFNNFETICRHDCHWYTLLATEYRPTGFVILKLGNVLWPAVKSGEEVEKKILGYSTKSWLLLLAISIFPHSQYWVYGYTEALFMVLFAGSLYFIIKRRWFFASLMVALVAITRPQGIWILMMYSLALIFKNIGPEVLFEKNRVKKILGHLILANSFFLSFTGWHFYESTGRPIDFLTGLKSHLPVWEADYFFLIISLFAMYHFLRRKEFSWIYLGGITLMMAEFPLYIGGYCAFSRFMSVNLGMFVFLIEFVENKRILQVALIVWSIVYLGMGVHQWFIGLPIF